MSTVKSKKLQVGTDASASNNFTIYQPSTPDGTLRIGVGNADSPTEVGRFTSAGYKPATAPAFSAIISANLTIPTSTFTKINFDTKDFDLTNDYDTTNYRFQPSVAGYYLLTANIANIGGQTSGTNSLLAIYKNGQWFSAGSGGSLIYFATSLFVYANGTTDYFDVYYYQNSGSNRTSTGGTDRYKFTGHLIQQA